MQLAGRLAIALLAAFVPAAAASAQSTREGFALDRHRPPPATEDGLRLEVPWTLAPGRWSAQLVADYAHAPLVLSQQTADGREEVGAIVSHRILLHAAFAVGLVDRVQAHLGVPIALVQSGSAPSAGGESFEASGAPAIGDPWVGASVRLTGAPSPDEPAGLGASLGASLVLPVGSQERLAGDGGIGARANLGLAYETADVTPVVNVGIAVRPSRTYLAAEVGTELTFGAGAHVPAGPVDLMIEIAGTTALAQAFTREGTALEALLGARYRHDSGVTLGGGAGLGLVDALGVPDVRGLVLLGVAAPREAPIGLVPDEDPEPIASPPMAPLGGEPPPPTGPSDGDRDGIADADDECPTEPETTNGLRDEDGCPEPVRVTDTHIEVEPPVRFTRRRAEIGQHAGDALWLVGELLRNRPDLTVLQIEGHTASDEGSGRRALAISERRAGAVVRFLVEAGVPEERLIAVGLGDAQPLDPADQDANRRVTIRIVERSR